jgi:3D (Asp-Asp-Asp) domain-containing protein
MLATAYYPGDPLAWRDGTITFLGEKMQRGIVAVDPRVIPLRTRVYVSGYGYGWAGDTGRVIKRKRIDLGVNNSLEEKDYMHVPVTVYILEKADSW